MRLHSLVVTTAAAADRTALSRVRMVSAGTPTARSPSGMCTSTTNRKRRASGTNTSGAAEAISPSSSTTAPSGMRRMTPSRAASAPESGLGQHAGHGVLVHHPTEVAQPAADEAVVGVAPAGPSWIVDALRYDDIQGCHSDRS